MIGLRPSARQAYQVPMSDMSNQFVYDVTEADFEARVVQRSYQVPVVIDFWADWCAPCHALGPMLERAVQARGGAVELARIDVDQSPQLAQAFGVQGIPAVKAVEDGRLVDEFVGAQPQNVVDQFLDGLLPSQPPPRRPASTRRRRRRATGRSWPTTPTTCPPAWAWGTCCWTGTRPPRRWRRSGRCSTTPRRMSRWPAPG
jgi:thioredoxin